MPSEDKNEVATEGQDRPGPYIVRKGHFVLINDDTGPVVPRPHRLAWKRLTDEKIVFLVRDPRDICVSGAHHWRQTPEVFLDRMIRGDVARCGRWDEYVSEWAHYHHDICIIPKYERLPAQIPIILDAFEIRYEIGEINKAIKRQSFASRKAKIWATHRSYRPTEPDNIEKEMRRNNMRKGIVGDWRNHFTSEMNDKIWGEFGWLMEGLGYERD
jgi:hypothetical protein